MAYVISTDNEFGDPDHVKHHNDLATLVKDLDARVTSGSNSGGTGSGLKVVKMTSAEYAALGNAGETFTNNYTDGSFEAGLPAGWSAWGVTVERTTEWAGQGSYSLKLTPSGTTGPHFTPGAASGMAYGMQAGQTYTIMATMRIPAVLTGTAHSRALRLWVITNDGTTTKEFQSSAAPNLVGTYDLRVTFTVPVGTTNAYFRIYHGYPTVGQPIYIDKVAVVPGAYTGEWYPSNQTGGGGAGYDDNTLYVIYP